jgi:hypothetical protein
VSLWYVLTAAQTTPLDADQNEFASLRWWTLDEVDSAPNGQLDPHLPRFIAKLRRDLAKPTSVGTDTP